MPEEQNNTAKPKKTHYSPAQRVAYVAVLTALAMIFSYVESLIPISAGIPGIKLGLANLVALSGLFLLPASDVLMIQIARILLTGFLFGNAAAILYSLAGGLLSFLIMFLLCRHSRFSVYGISMAGGAAHNIGQLIVAALVVENAKLAYYMPILVIAGVAAGFVMGFLSSRILPVLRGLMRRSGARA